MGNVININPANDVMYHLEGDKFEGVSLSPTEKNKLYFGTPCDYSNGKRCSVYLDGGFHDYDTEKLKNLMVAWIALVDPDLLRWDKS